MREKEVKTTSIQQNVPLKASEVEDNLSPHDRVIVLVLVSRWTLQFNMGRYPLYSQSFNSGRCKGIICEQKNLYIDVTKDQIQNLLNGYNRLHQDLFLKDLL
jgi:hypothetical protein